MMKQHAKLERGWFPFRMEAFWGIMFGEIKRMREDIFKILDALGTLLVKPTPVLRDNGYVMDRIGVSDRTVRRFIQRGELKVYDVINKMNFYLDEDVEELRRRYRGN